VYKGADETIAMLRKYAHEHGPFDGLIGFSQGAIVTLILSALNHQSPSNPVIPGLRFAVLLSGMKPRDPRFHDLFLQPIPLPALAIYGATDWLGEECRKYPQLLSNVQLATHSGGHEPPHRRNGAKALDQLTAFLLPFMDDEPATSGSASTAGSVEA
jgi:hypothetical protein